MPPGRIEARLKDLGIELPEPASPVANYIPYTLVPIAAEAGGRPPGALVVVSGQIPLRDGRIAYTGKLGPGVSVERGQEAARLCFVNLLAHLRVACGGDLGRVRRVVRLGGFIAAPPEFTQHAQVMNGASDLAAGARLRRGGGGAVAGWTDRRLAGAHRGGRRCPVS